MQSSRPVIAANLARTTSTSTSTGRTTSTSHRPVIAANVARTTSTSTSTGRTTSTSTGCTTSTSTATWVAISLALAACGGSESRPDSATDNFDRGAMLAHLATNVLLPMQATFEQKVLGLPAAVEAYCNALDAGNVGATRDAALAAWTGAVDAWELADAVLVGPAAMTEKDLRYKIYSWPLLAPCGLNRDTAARWADPGSYNITLQPPNERSLLGIEFLLLSTSTEHGCPIEPTGWSALGADLPRARCRLAHVLAQDVAARGVELHTAWKADGGNYVAELAKAGQSGSSIPSAHEAVNRISDGMFYVDRIVKDMKLAEPSGIATNICNAPMQQPYCLEEVELLLADRATHAIRANFISLKQVFTGTTPSGDGPSFEEFLRAVGQGELADRMVTNLDNAIAKANALPESFVGALQTNRAAIVDTHAAIRSFTDDLKSQFLTVLALDIPDDVAADND